MSTALAPPLTAALGSCDLSVAIVNYRSLDHLLRCLTTWNEAVAGIEAELHVVENGTGEAVRERVRELVPKASVIVLEESIGFSQAINLALRDSRGRHVALVNPDTLLAPRSLAHLSIHLDDHPDVGIVGPRVWDDAQRTRIQRSWRRFPTLATSLFNRTSFLSRMWPANRWTRAYLNYDKSCTEIQETDWLSGCCMVIRGELFRRLGGLDEGYPMFCEDVDICRSCKRSGARVVYDPRAEIVHFVGGSTRRVHLRSIWLHHRSMAHYVCKVHGPLHPGTWILLMGIWVRFSLRLASSAGGAS